MKIDVLGWFFFDGGHETVHQRVDYIKALIDEKLKKDIDIICYSDNCGGRQKTNICCLFMLTLL